MRFFTLSLYFVCIISNCYGQFANSRGSVPDNVPEYPLALYKAATTNTQNLYNGRAYYIYDARQEQFQFFNLRKLENGTVFYDGQRYDSIPMMYDLVRDELVIKHANGYENMLLASGKVQYFTLYDHHFYYLESGKGIDPGMKTGFYDQLYTGKTKTIVRRTKERQEKIVDRKIIALFPGKNFYYLFKGGKYNPVHSKKSILALFPDHKKELRKVLRDKDLNFRKNRENAIITMVSRYDELTK